MNHIYLSGQSRTLAIEDRPISLTIVSEYLINVMSCNKNDFEIELINFTNHESGHFSTFGTARLEILFYEKTFSGKRQEQIVLYGVAENNRSQLKSFTLHCNTCWIDEDTRHLDDRYFDSIIIDGLGPSHIVPSSTFTLSILNSNGELAGRCSAILRFVSELQSGLSLHASRIPSIPEVINFSNQYERGPLTGQKAI